MPPDGEDRGHVWEIRDSDDVSRPAYERRLLLRTAHILEQASRKPGSVRGVLCVLMLAPGTEPSEVFGDSAAGNDMYVAFFGSVSECSAVALAALEDLASDEAA